MDLQNHWPRSLFFAVRPDAAAAERLTAVVAHFAGGGIMTAPITPDRWHVTLCWLGQYDTQMPPNLIADAAAAAASLQAAPASISLDLAGGTGERFLLRPSDGAPALHAVRRKLKTALTRKGIHVHPWSNLHLTLSYHERRTPEVPIEPIAWAAGEFVLIESLIGKTVHLERGRWPLSTQG